MLYSEVLKYTMFCRDGGKCIMLYPDERNFKFLRLKRQQLLTKPEGSFLGKKVL